MSNQKEEIFEEKYVRSEVVKEKGRWVVYLEIGDLSESVRHRIRSYPTQKLANISAKLIKRAAERENPFNR